jgi:hypothetical protein
MASYATQGWKNDDNADIAKTRPEFDHVGAIQTLSTIDLTTEGSIKHEIT